MQCDKCKKEFDQWQANDLFGKPLNNLCLNCNNDEWKEWENEHVEELIQIKTIEESGHSHHCACRKVWGDGECECDLYEKGYDPYAWMKKNES